LKTLKRDTNQNEKTYYKEKSNLGVKGITKKLKITLNPSLKVTTIPKF